MLNPAARDLWSAYLAETDPIAAELLRLQYLEALIRIDDRLHSPTSGSRQFGKAMIRGDQAPFAPDDLLT